MEINKHIPQAEVGLNLIRGVLFVLIAELLS